MSGVGYGNIPMFGERSITTTIRVRNGETNILAGLIRDEEREVLEGIPGLSDLPIIGRLFAHNRMETQETDIIVTLTPRILRVLDLEEIDLRAFRFDGDSGASLDLSSRRTNPHGSPALRPLGGGLPAPVPRREPGLVVPVRPPPLDPR